MNIAMFGFGVLFMATGMVIFALDASRKNVWQAVRGAAFLVSGVIVMTGAEIAKAVAK